MTNEREPTRKRGRPRTRLPKIERLPDEADSAYYKRCAEEYQRIAKQSSQEEAKKRERDDIHRKCVIGGYVLSEIRRLQEVKDLTPREYKRLFGLLKLVNDGVTRNDDRTKYFISELTDYRSLRSPAAVDDGG